MRFVTGRTVRVWVDANTWEETRVRALGELLSANRTYARMTREELVDALTEHDGVHAVQVLEQQEGGYHTGVMAYTVPFDQET